MSRALLRISLIFIASLSLFGCIRRAETPTKHQVNLAIWANYLSPELQKRFTDETGIELNISNYSSNEELLAKIQAAGSGFDLAVPSDYMVEVMHKLELLQPLDKFKITNATDLEPSLLKQSFDPENTYSLPFAWATAGIAVNRELFKGPIHGWKDVFSNAELSGKISMLDDMREVMAVALKLQSQSLNSTDEAKLRKAQELLKTLKPKIKMFRSDVIDTLVNKEVVVAHTFSSDALQAARKSKGKIEYILPAEGGSRSIDNMVILKSAHNVQEAHVLINFLLSQKSNVEFVNHIMGGAVLKSTRSGLERDLQVNKALFPDPTLLNKFEFIHDLGASTRVYDRLWTELKAQ